MELQVKLSSKEVEKIIAEALLSRFPGHKADVNLSAYGSTSVDLEPVTQEVVGDQRPEIHMAEDGGQYVLVITTKYEEFRLTLSESITMEEFTGVAAALRGCRMSSTLIA